MMSGFSVGRATVPPPPPAQSHAADVCGDRQPSKPFRTGATRHHPSSFSLECRPVRPDHPSAGPLGRALGARLRARGELGTRWTHTPPHPLPCGTWHPPASLLFFSLAPATALPTPTAVRRTSSSPHPHLTCLPSVVLILSPTVSLSPLPLPLRASASPAVAAGHPPWRAAVPRRPAAGHVGGAGWAACPLGGRPPRSALLLPRPPLLASNRRHHAPGGRGGNGVVGDGGGGSSGGASRRSTPPRCGRSPLSATAPRGGRRWRDTRRAGGGARRVRSGYYRHGAGATPSRCRDGRPTRPREGGGDQAEDPRRRWGSTKRGRGWIEDNLTDGASTPSQLTYHPSVAPRR